jgi:hypothetical protein
MKSIAAYAFALRRGFTVAKPTLKWRHVHPCGAFTPDRRQSGTSHIQPETSIKALT